MQGFPWWFLPFLFLITYAGPVLMITGGIFAAMFFMGTCPWYVPIIAWALGAVSYLLRKL